MKSLALACALLAVSGTAVADGFTYRVALPNQKTQLIHSDESSAAHMSDIHEYRYVSTVSSLSLEDWRKLESSSQLPKFDVMKCDGNTCWYGSRNTVDLGDQIDITTAGTADNRVTEISVVHTYVDSAENISTPDQLIPISLPKIVTFTTNQAARLALNQPFVVTTPVGNVVVTLTEAPGLPPADAASPSNLNRK